MTLCNNLFPVFGGSINEDVFSGVIDKYFSTKSKQLGGGLDSNRVRLLSHDFKSLLKKFAQSESFSRDSHGGGPEHNMQFVPFLAALILHSLQNGSNTQQNLITDGNDDENFMYVQEKRLAEFLELSTRQRQAFLTRLVEEGNESSALLEEQKASDSEEEDKQMEDEDGESESQSDAMSAAYPKGSAGKDKTAP